MRTGQTASVLDLTASYILLMGRESEPQIASRAYFQAGVVASIGATENLSPGLGNSGALLESSARKKSQPWTRTDARSPTTINHGATWSCGASNELDLRYQ